MPFLAHWPAAGWTKRHVSATLTHAVDIVPTLLEITGAKTPSGLEFDGLSIRSLLDPAARVSGWPERMLVTDSQRVRDPIKWKQTAVMQGTWRLINGRELYDISSDPAQERNVFDAHPDRVARMRAFYDRWWAELEPTFAQTTEIHLGHPLHPVVSLTGHDWIQEAMPPWNQQHIRQAHGFGVAASAPAKARKATKAAAAPSDVPAAGRSRHEGHWAVKVIRAGSYDISVRRWPAEANHPITAALPAGENVPGATRAFRAHSGVAIPAVRATLRIDGRDIATKSVSAGDAEVVFATTLTAGSHRLAPVFLSADGNAVGAYYAVVTARTKR